MRIGSGTDGRLAPSDFTHILADANNLADQGDLREAAKLAARATALAERGVAEQYGNETVVGTKHHLRPSCRLDRPSSRRRVSGRRAL